MKSKHAKSLALGDFGRKVTLRHPHVGQSDREDSIEIDSCLK